MAILEVEGDGGKLSLDPVKNTAGVAAAQLLERFAPRAGVELRLRKGLPLGSGLGSSAASAAAQASESRPPRTLLSRATCASRTRVLSMSRTSISSAVSG